MKKIGFKINDRINALILHHEENISLIKHLRKKYYNVKTASTYINKHSDYSNKQFNIFYRYWIFLKKPKQFFRNPILGIAVLVFKTLEFIAAGLFLSGSDNIRNNIYCLYQLFGL